MLSNSLKINEFFMNKLSTKQRARILSLLVEGTSTQSIARHEGVSIVTVGRLLSLAGQACGLYHYDYVRDIPGKRTVQCDEIWSFVYAKERRAPHVTSWDGAGHAWTFTALDTASRLLVSFLISHNRGTKAATALFEDVLGRLDETPNLVTDGLKSYKRAAKQLFGKKHKKVLSQTRKGEQTDHNTAYVERHNLTIRTTNKRFARRTNAHSKKFSKHLDMMNLLAVHYNFCKIHTTLQITPAMEVGLSDTVRDFDWIVWLIDSTTAPPRKPGPKVGTKYQPRRKQGDQRDRRSGGR